MPTPTGFQPFTTQDLINLPELDASKSKPWTGFVFDAAPCNDLLNLADPIEPVLPELKARTFALDLEDVTLSRIDSVDSSSATSDEEKADEAGIEGAAQEHGDFWRDPDLLKLRGENKLVSWDRFHTHDYEESPTSYISEAGPAVFDALLRKFMSKTHDDKTGYVEADTVVVSLFDLGLGRGSPLFRWDAASQRFELPNENFTISGLSRDSIRHVVNQYLDAGAQVRKLRMLDRPATTHSATRVALGSIIKSLLDATEEFIEIRRKDVHTLISLNDVYRRPLVLFAGLDRLTKELRGVSSDADLISAVIDFVDRYVLEEPQFEGLMHNLVSRMLQPTLQSIAADAGFITQYSIKQVSGNVVSRILSPPLLKIYSEVKGTLQILLGHGSHFVPLQNQRGVEVSLSIEFGSVTLAGRHADASTYEQVRRGVDMNQEFGKSHSHNYELDGDMQRTVSIERDPFTFTHDLFSLSAPDAGVEGLIKTESLNEEVAQALLATTGPLETLTSYRQAIDLSLSPFLMAQHRLLSYSALHILFQDQKIVSHIEILGRFQLLTDGTFVSKLSTALFDPEQFSGEGSRRMHAKTGLRLQSRSTWPPATSELRLALMGILTESMSNVNNPTLSDSVSFAIRDLSDEELERCRDIDSIYALDFLRLNYKPASTIIAAIIPHSSHDKYDRIFNQLLRLLRMTLLTQSMLRNTHHKSRRERATSSLTTVDRKFTILAHNFTTTLAAYYQTTVIAQSWSSFEAQLRHISTSIEKEDYTATLNFAGSLGQLHDLHDHTLDRIIHGMGLKHRQSEGKGIIDRLFEVILRYAAVRSRGGRAGNDTARGEERNVTNDDRVTIERLQKDFEVHVHALIAWLKREAARDVGDDTRTSSNVRVRGVSGGDTGPATFQHLLLRLEWNGFWTRA